MGKQQNTWSSSVTYGSIPNFSSGTSFETGETEEEKRARRKKLIMSMIDGDDYLLQEIIIDLRRKKLDQLKNGKR